MIVPPVLYYFFEMILSTMFGSDVVDDGIYTYSAVPSFLSSWYGIAIFAMLLLPCVFRLIYSLAVVQEVD